MICNHSYLNKDSTVFVDKDTDNVFCFECRKHLGDVDDFSPDHDGAGHYE